MKNISIQRFGFTLIELLVVVAIIGILASIVLSSLSDARARARDASRQSDIATIQKQLEIYYLDNGEYPRSYGSVIGSAWMNSADSSWVTLETDMGIDLPEDSINSTGGWAATGDFMNYSYFSPGNYFGCPAWQFYILVYRLESRDATGNENIGVTRCDTGAQFWYSNGSITVGRSPLQ